MLQSLAFAPNKNKSTQDEYKGFKKPVAGAYYIFASKTDIESRSRFITFKAYGMGKIALAIWGGYDRESDSLIIESACKYEGYQFIAIQNYWKQHKFIYIGAVSENKISRTMDAAMGTKNIYKEKKLFCDLYEGKITPAQYLNYVGGAPGSDAYSIAYQLITQSPDDPTDEEIDVLYQVTVEEVHKEEKGINTLELSVRDPLISRVLEVVAGVLQSQESIKFNRCPTHDECQYGSEAPGECDVYDYGVTIFSLEDPRSLM